MPKSPARCSARPPSRAALLCTLEIRLLSRSPQPSEAFLSVNCWIASQDALADWIGSHARDVRVALDTEFVRERTFHPQLALAQLGWPSGPVALVDVLATGSADAFVALLGDRTVTKIMHSASEDLQALQHTYQTLPRPLFDTQIAAAMCGYGAGIGYQRLVVEMTGHALEKGETRSDWLRRPLSEGQLHYAAEDVRYLPEMHLTLEAKLVALGRLDWLREDCERLLAAALLGDDPQPHLSMRSAQRMDAVQQARLRRLLRWRDLRAREADKPRSWIIDPELSALLATRPPPDRRSFDALLDSVPKAPRRERGALWELVSTPLSAEEQAIPLALQPDPALRPVLRRAQEAVAAVAAELEIPEGLLAAKRHLDTLLTTGEWPTALSGWRRPLLEPRLAPVLAGIGPRAVRAAAGG